MILFGTRWHHGWPQPLLLRLCLVWWLLHNNNHNTQCAAFRTIRALPHRPWSFRSSNFQTCFTLAHKRALTSLEETPRQFLFAHLRGLSLDTLSSNNNNNNSNDTSLLETTTATTVTATSAVPMTNANGQQNEKKVAARINWVVRPVTPADAAELEQLFRVSYETLLVDDYEADNLAHAMPYITHASDELLTCGTWFVVQHPTTKAILGCGGWTHGTPYNAKNHDNQDDDVMDDNNNNEQEQEPVVIPCLRHVACHPAWTRRGIGTAWWKRSLKEITQHYGPNIPMEVYSSLTARGFYESLGFVVVQETNVTLGEGDDNICLFPALRMRREGGGGGSSPPNE